MHRLRPSRRRYDLHTSRRDARRCDFVKISFVASICSRMAQHAGVANRVPWLSTSSVFQPPPMPRNEPARPRFDQRATDFAVWIVSRWMPGRIPVASFSFLVKPRRTRPASEQIHHVAVALLQLAAARRRGLAGTGMCECSTTQRSSPETALFECDSQLGRGDRVVGEKIRAAEFRLCCNAHLAPPILSSGRLSALAQRQRRQSVDDRAARRRRYPRYRTTASDSTRSIARKSAIRVLIAATSTGGDTTGLGAGIFAVPNNGDEQRALDHHPSDEARRHMNKRWSAPRHRFVAAKSIIAPKRRRQDTDLLSQRIILDVHPVRRDSSPIERSERARKNSLVSAGDYGLYQVCRTAGRLCVAQASAAPPDRPGTTPYRGAGRTAFSPRAGLPQRSGGVMPALPILLGSIGLGGAWLTGIAWLAAPHRTTLLAVAVACSLAVARCS